MYKQKYGNIIEGKIHTLAVKLPRAILRLVLIIRETHINLSELNVILHQLDRIIQYSIHPDVSTSGFVVELIGVYLAERRKSRGYFCKLICRGDGVEELLRIEITVSLK